MVTTEMGQDVSVEAKNRTKHQLEMKCSNYPQVIFLAIFVQTQVVLVETSKLSNLRHLAQKYNTAH